MSAAMNNDVRPLLIELLTEELPPKALHALGQAFAAQIVATLTDLHLLVEDAQCQDFATPRRLAVHLSAVRGQATEQVFHEKLMPLQVGLDANGAATPALLKKLAAKGWQHLRVEDLTQEADGKQTYLYAQGTAAGVPLAQGVQQALDAAIANLPIPKLMQYQLADGVTTVKFARPAHRLLALWGDEVVPVNALGLQADRVTQGHRFLAPKPLTIPHADRYEETLAGQAYVLPSFTQRRAHIAAQLQEQAQALNAGIGTGAEEGNEEVQALLDEVTALVEWPVVYAGEFDPTFLSVPPECLILTMRLNQKYFPLFEHDSGKLTHRFLIVSNMQVADPANIIEGNQRVVAPRLFDAQFFFDTDRKRPLHTRIPALANAVYHNKLGSQLQRSQRIERIACWLAGRLGADATLAARAAQLLKADLTTDMVAEFPELQGIMGAYYAQADGEDAQVVAALRGQYRIRLDDTITPETLIATLLFISERAETLVGIWGIGLAPTGERDPYALRRAALGLISALEQQTIGNSLHLDWLLEAAAQTFEAGVLADGTVDAVRTFVYERYRNLLYTSHDKHVVDAVMTDVAPPMFEIRARIAACVAFARLPEAASLIAANKRLANLLKKADLQQCVLDADALTEPAERTLAQTIATLTPIVEQHLSQRDFAASLTALAGVKQAVDDFFEHVMVMADDPAVRANRLALLTQLHGLMNRVADISRLAT